MKLFICFILLFNVLCAEEHFQVIVLGCGGGPIESNLSGYLLGPKEGSQFIALDAGTLLSGLFIANKKNHLSELHVNKNSKLDIEAEALRSHVCSYLISHAHLDHVAGLIINSTMDLSKEIYGLDSTIDFIRDHLFNWKIWPNFGSEGEKPLNKYHYRRVEPESVFDIQDLGMRVEPFVLSHPGGYQSTAYVIEHQGVYVVYFGDTSPDALEKEKHIQKVWKRIAPLVREKKVAALFLECSYEEDRADNQLFGHLKPEYMVEELNNLAKLVDENQKEEALKGLKVIVTHIKSTLVRDKPVQEVIKQELKKLNNLNVEFIFPEQGEKILL